ncbi:unnamed protein product, partial [Prorocentrum cordatum]
MATLPVDALQRTGDLLLRSRLLELPIAVARAAGTAARCEARVVGAKFARFDGLVAVDTLTEDDLRDLELEELLIAVPAVFFLHDTGSIASVDTMTIQGASASSSPSTGRSIDGERYPTDDEHGGVGMGHDEVGAARAGVGRRGPTASSAMEAATPRRATASHDDLQSALESFKHELLQAIGGQLSVFSSRIEQAEKGSTEARGLAAAEAPPDIPGSLFQSGPSLSVPAPAPFAPSRPPFPEFAQGGRESPSDGSRAAPAGRRAPPSEQVSRAAPGGRADLDLYALVESGGRAADKATQLAKPQALEKVGGPKQAKEDELTLDDLLFGDAASSSREAGLAPRINGTRGAARPPLLNGAIEREPQERSAHVETAALAEPGCSTTGTPWNATPRGRQRIRFGRLEDNERFWEMLASLHALRTSRRHDLGARAGQRLKATQQTENASGPRRLARPTTLLVPCGLPYEWRESGHLARARPLSSEKKCDRRLMLTVDRISFFCIPQWPDAEARKTTLAFDLGASELPEQSVSYEEDCLRWRGRDRIAPASAVPAAEGQGASTAAQIAHQHCLRFAECPRNGGGSPIAPPPAQIESRRVSTRTTARSLASPMVLTLQTEYNGPHLSASGKGT